jgi:hypothetical protein
MQRRVSQWALALFVLVFAGVAATPACTIQLCQGDQCPNGSDAGGSAGAGQGGADGTASSGSGAAPPDHPAADAAVLAGSDPVELRKAQLKSNVASYMLWGYVQEKTDPAIVQGGDPAALEAAAQQVAEMYGAEIWSYTDQYVESLDPSALPEATIVIPKTECITTYGCAATMFCSWNFPGEGERLVPCHITGCGDGACPTCPSLFDLDKLIVKNYCSFTCVKDEKAVVGIGIRLHIQISGTLEGCWLLSKPVPCTGVGCPG